ncbi:hypothetical protein JOE38_001409 [Clavibacter michiganensis]|uniref:hypothetical protein n=1 Tax=Clavibacter michiganensis TaxID=28447 RepID=UPI0019567E4C|nr:hypothetical protein [Clavibacter michiganensis]MBM7411586.1 hypothetical protein [Clavibacter michiganensis]
MTTRGTVASRIVAGICLATLFNIPAMAATAAEPPSSHPLSMASGAHPISTGATADRVWFVGSPTESFSDVVARAIAADPASAREWKDVLSGVTSRVQGGADVHLPGDAANLDDEKVQLADATGLATRSASSPESDEVRPDALGGTEFELRGVAVNSNHTWQVHTEIDGGFCDPEGCETTDVTRQTWKVTPGRGGDRFNFTSTRVGSGNLSDIYANLAVDCNGRECGSGTAGKAGPRNGNGSGSPVVVHRSNAGGAQVDRIQMHAFFSRNRSDYFDSVRTGTAQCGTGSTYACVY